MTTPSDEQVADPGQEYDSDAVAFPRRGKKRGFGRLLRVLGPGIVTGAADDDPSGIATYSQAGAQFGFGTLWSILLTLPLMIAVQEACMRIGAVTGKGLAAIIRDSYPKKVLYPIVLLVTAANTFNIGSDIGAMAASANLLLPGVPFVVLAIGFVVIILVLEVLVPYRTYVRILKWLAFALFAYLATAFLIAVPWAEAVKATVIPHIEFNQQFLFVLVAIFGTTISPYLFFWQTSNVVEDERMQQPASAGEGPPPLTRTYLRKLRIDTVLGMFFSNIVAWFIIVVGAVVLNQGGVTNIVTAADAAQALEPLVKSFPNAGLLAKLIFAVGVIGIGLMSIPVLAGSSSYAITETFNWKEGLFRKFRQARAFYLVIIIGTLTGLVLNFVGFDPVQALVLTAVFNGIVAVPLIFIIARLTSRTAIMGNYVNGRWSKIGLWCAFAIMGAAAIALLSSYL
ncbi:divalent metal cation transporter [Cryobacterium sp. 10I1]|uniref:NRAMP family divalent metal transporter n=1 Tax=unclassified Cryobacterium TaxID=2649013 RepID=UPI002B22B6A5|nr:MULTISPECIES: divalent metal cation transporter [unclassified Cryobacterium]MEB0202495.1 divalent metal cation transporter [Cryobacterium sp. 5I3]MEB0304384.1 divalent metal cation transporter [Cryobacterium sp. 10I1]